MKLVPVILSLLLSCCTSVYVQTGAGSIERTTDIERSVKGKTTVEQPKKEETQ